MGHLLMRLVSSFFEFIRAVDRHSKYSLYRKKYDFHPSAGFNGDDILLYGEGKIVVGEGSYIGRNSSIQAAFGHSVIIGKHCAISHYVAIYTSSVIANQIFSFDHKKEIYEADVVIEDFAWIGYGVFICPGVKIGENAVVGAGAVVTKDIPAYSIAAGVPAKVIKYKNGHPKNT